MFCLFTFSKMSLSKTKQNVSKNLFDKKTSKTSDEGELKTPTKNETSKTSDEGELKTPTKNETDTPRKKQKSETICSIVNVSDMILSPSKTPSKSGTSWFEFGIATPDSTTLRRVGCFSKQWHEFLNSNEVKPIVGNNKKTIVINNILNGDRGLCMGNNSSFGSISDVEEPFKLKAAPKVSVTDCLFKLDIPDNETTTVSVKCKVMKLTNEWVQSRNCTVYKYKLNDGQFDIVMGSFQIIDVEPMCSYDFNNVSLICHNNERQLRYVCTSWYKACKNINVNKVKKETKQAIKIKGCKKQKMHCVECSVEIPTKNIDDGIYTCDGCEVTALLPDVSYDITALFIETQTIKALSLSNELFTSIGSMKILLTQTFSVICKDSAIIQIEKE